MTKALRLQGLALLSGVLFGLATPATKPLLNHAGPFLLAGLLYLGAALATGLLGLARRDTLRPAANERWALLGSIAFGGLAGPVLLMLGLQQANAANVSIWLNLELVATAILGVALFRERLNTTTLAALGLVLGASTLVAWSGNVAGIKAGLFVAAACLCWGIDNQFTANIHSISAPAMTFWKGAAAGTTNLALGLLVDGAPTPSVLPMALGIGAVSYGLSIILYVTSARVIGATRAQVSFSTAPIWGITAAFLFLHEPASWHLWVALVAIAGALALLAFDARKRAGAQI